MVPGLWPGSRVGRVLPHLGLMQLGDGSVDPLVVGCLSTLVAEGSINLAEIEGLEVRTAMREDTTRWS